MIYFIYRTERRRNMELTAKCVGPEIKDKETLYQMIKEGLDDVENGRVLPLEEAFDQITELRKARRKANV
jgi:predicted transcriptional regulator